MAESVTQMPKKGSKKPAKTPEKAPETGPEIETQAEEPDAQPIQSAGTTAEPFPEAPRPKSKGGYIDPPGPLFEYERKIPLRLMQRFVKYVNREWPVLNRLQDLTPDDLLRFQQKKLRVPKYIDKLSGPFETEDWRMEMLRRYGSGDYTVWINDAGVLGHKHVALILGHNVCKAFVSIRDEDFPPVLDLRKLDMKDPRNESYVQMLRLKGVEFPEDKQGEADMNSEVVSKLTDQVGQLANEVAQGKTDRLLDGIKEEIRKVAPEAKTSDMVEMVKLMIAMNTKPGATGPDPVVALFQTQLAALQVELQAERAERRKYEDEVRQRANAPAPDPFQHFTQMADLFGKLKPLFTAMGTGAETATPVVRAARMGTLEFLSEVIPKIADSQILNAIAVRMLTATPTPTDGITGPPAPSQPQPALHPNPQADFENFMRFAITPALVQAMADKDTGARFAEWVWDYYPNRLEQLQKFTHPRLPGLMGPAAIIMAYRNSSVWPTLAMNGEEAFQIFVKDFCEWKSPEDQASEPEAAAPPASGEPIDLDEETKESV